ncbi:trypsin-like cysteine/serine peptidase domain-containing protein, partial [Pavlovales sp. CCMP2436]
WDDGGHIATSFHVVQGATELTVTIGSQLVLTASVIGADVDRDIAVLLLHAKAPSGTLRVGQRTLAIGCPFGLDFTLTTGLRRPDSSGRVIGVNVAILTTSGSSAGVGMSIPVDAVRLTVEQILTRGHVLRPSIGVRMAPDHFVQHQLGVSSGVLIFEIQTGSGADQAGLRGTTRSAHWQTMEGIKINDAVELELATLEDDVAGKLREKSRRKVTIKVSGSASKL